MGKRFSTPIQTGPGPYPASCTTDIGSFTGVKRPGRGADHPPPSKCRGHERVGLYLYSLSGPQWPLIGRTFTFTLPLIIINYSFTSRGNVFLSTEARDFFFSETSRLTVRSFQHPSNQCILGVLSQGIKRPEGGYNYPLVPLMLYFCTKYLSSRYE